MSTARDPRDRLTRGITRSRLALEARRSGGPAAIWVVTAVCALIAVSYFVVRVSATFGRSTQEVTFDIADDFGVFVGVDEVRFRGVPAGTITAVRHHGTQLVLTAKIQKRYAPIYRNAKAEMRSVTPLNDVYLNITDPGTPESGKLSAHAPLAEGQTRTLITVPDVLDSIRQDQRTALHTILDQLGNGLQDRGVELRHAFLEAAPLLDAGARLTHELAVRKTVTRRLVHDTALLTAELGGRETGLRRLVATGAATLGTLQQSTPDLDATLTGLPPTLAELSRTLQSVRGVVGDVDHGLADLRPVAAAVPRALTAAGRLGRSLAPAATALTPAVSALTPTARALRPVAEDLSGTVAALRPLVPTVSRLTQRVVDCRPGIAGFFQWNTSLTKFGDSNAPLPRGNLAVGVPDAGAPGIPRRQPMQSCAPGPIVTGRPTVEGDGH